MQQKIDALTKMIKRRRPDKPRIRRLYHEIVLTNRKIRYRAKKEMRLNKQGGVPWSPEVQDIMNRKKLWASVMKLKLNLSVSHKRIQRLMKRCKNTDAWTVPLATAKDRLWKAKKDWWQVQKDAYELRRTFLDKLAEAKAKISGSSAAKELRKLKHREKQREDAR